MITNTSWWAHTYTERETDRYWVLSRRMLGFCLYRCGSQTLTGWVQLWKHIRFSMGVWTHPQHPTNQISPMVLSHHLQRNHRHLSILSDQDHNVSLLSVLQWCIKSIGIWCSQCSHTLPLPNLLPHPPHPWAYNHGQCELACLEKNHAFVEDYDWLIDWLETACAGELELCQ